MMIRSAYPSRSSAMPQRPSVPRTLIPLRVGSGRCRRMKAVSSMSGSITTWAEVGRVAATHVDYAQSPARLGHAVDDVGQPLHVVELQPHRIVKINVGLVCTADPERERSPIREIWDQQCAISAGPEHQAC